MTKKLMILPVAIILLSCGDGRKVQTASEEETPEFEVVGNQKEEPVDTMNDPVSLSTILTGKDPVDKDVKDGPSSQYDDPLGGDESYLDGDDGGYDY